jgi:uncharacterized membrane protein YgcG
MTATQTLRNKTFLLTIVVVVLLTVSALSVAQNVTGERILSFHSDIDIAADGSMSVTETIRVRAEGDRIRRGLFREFPTRYSDGAGNTYRVEFEVLQLLRDGQPESWSADLSRNGVRVDFGDERLLQVPRVYEYQLQYRTHRQIGFFESHDELYWNVTGHGWDFVIDAASASIVLPGQVSAELLGIEGYTGAMGETDTNIAVNSLLSQAEIVSTVALLPAQGLTVVVSWPKGVVIEPGAAQRAEWFLSDNLGVLLALAALLLSAMYLLFCWLRVGRDPPRGVIFAHYEPPQYFSPAAARYLMQMHYDNKTLTSAIVSLAVKACLQIDQQGSQYTLHKRQSAQVLSTGESVLYRHLFRASDSLVLDNTNHLLLSKAKAAHAQALGKEFREPYFVRNGWYLMPSILLTLLMLLVTLGQSLASPVSLLVFGSQIPLHLLFFWLLHQPTVLGREMMDKLEGFKLYLEVAEKDDLNIKHPPQLTPELFEEYLPYAIALGVEVAWSKKFALLFADMKAEQRLQYQPHWYIGIFDAARLSAFTKSIGSGFDSAISSATTVPGSSSGAGGGGFSGGGGGGGGGGGR